MCLAYDGFNHSGSGRGRWYDVSTSSAVGRCMPMVWASEGELGSGGSVARLDADWLPGSDEKSPLPLPAAPDGPEPPAPPAREGVDMAVPIFWLL